MERNLERSELLFKWQQRIPQLWEKIVFVTVISLCPEMIFHTIMSLKSKEWIFFVNISAFWKVIIGYNRSIDKHNFLFVANFLHLKLISGLLDSFDKFQKSDLNVMFDICSNYWVKLQNLLFLFFNFNPSWFSMYN